MLFWIFFIPFFIIYMTVLLVTKGYLTIAFIFIASYSWYRVLKEAKNSTKKRDKENLKGNILIFKKRT